MQDVLTGGGTIRWYRLQDGAELLTLFLHPENQHWVLWSPQGYYTASIGGESLVGWHVNHGIERAADFYQIGQLQMLDINYIINELTSQQNGIIVFTASKAQQFSYESTALGHGFFTQALLDTFTAKTEEIKSNSKISVFEMIPSITNRVEALALKAKIQQNPTITMPRAIADYDVLIAGEH